MLRLILKETSGNLPTSLFDLVEGETKLGILQIRHKPSRAPEVPAAFASHVYYEILPEFRGRGYGNEILRLGLLEAKKIVRGELVITCREQNVASKKCIEKNGGLLKDSIALAGPGGDFLKYTFAMR